MPSFIVEDLIVNSNLERIRIDRGRNVWTVPLSSVRSVSINSLSYQYLELVIELRNGARRTTWQISTRWESDVRRFASGTRSNLASAAGARDEDWTYRQEKVSYELIGYIVGVLIFVGIVIWLVNS